MNTLEYLVKKYDIDITQKSPIEIRGVGRLDLLRWLRELNMKKGVEVGVEKGVYSHLICEINSQMTLWGVDPYEKYDGYREYKDQAEMNWIFEEMKKKLASPIKHGQFHIVRKKSMDALADFADESLDFVYIDANHEFNYPLKDIEGWYPKVKKGGILAGHDYVRHAQMEFTVKDGLKEFTLKNNIHPWFILGLYRKRRGELRDSTRSWLIPKL